MSCKYGSQWRGWKYIRASWDCFLQYLTFKVGDGTRIQFWQDSWCGDQPLRERYSELYRLAHDPEAIVASHL